MANDITESTSTPTAASTKVHGRDHKGRAWAYTDTVKDHFFNPRNLIQAGDEEKFKANGIGRVGSPACGDELLVWLKVEEGSDRVKECKWQTYGCGSAIAATSMMSVMISENDGMKVDDVLKIKPQDIMQRLGGLPNRKVHCSVLGDKALRAALNDYFRRTGQIDRIQVSGAKIVDERLKITDKDIEEAVLDGAHDLETVQQKLKVGVGLSPESVAEIEQLIRFYKEKYYGGA